MERTREEILSEIQDIMKRSSLVGEVENPALSPEFKYMVEHMNDETDEGEEIRRKLRESYLKDKKDNERFKELIKEL